MDFFISYHHLSILMPLEFSLASPGEGYTPEKTTYLMMVLLVLLISFTGSDEWLYLFTYMM
jgi:hypothetical protein